MDILERRRPLREAQKRGGWANPSNLVRYEKAARVTEQLHLLNPQTARHARECADLIGDVLQRRCRPCVLRNLRRE